ncbi:MAG: enoyl-CoA hydratase-related protein [Acidimicrobiales bacterium]
MAKAKYYLLTADFLSGKQADEIGLVSKSVPRERLMDEAMTVATKIATGPQDAVRWTKRNLNLWLTQAAPAFDASLGFEMLSFWGPDAAEGLVALREKRAEVPDGPVALESRAAAFSALTSAARRSKSSSHTR